MATAPISSPLPDDAKQTVGAVLQDSLADFVDLSLTGKQLHWNVVGRNFREAHLHLDELVDLARGYADDVAERAAAVGVSPDGRTATVAKTTGLPGATSRTSTTPSWSSSRSSSSGCASASRPPTSPTRSRRTCSSA
jgi:DNA-binding ferritin-like protein